MKLLRQLRENEPHDLNNYLRMDNETYRSLLELVRKKNSKQKTNMRNSVSAEERLTATLRYLATGNSYEDLNIYIYIYIYFNKIFPKHFIFGIHC
jgi:hypothetical protein